VRTTAATYRRVNGWCHLDRLVGRISIGRPVSNHRKSSAGAAAVGWNRSGLHRLVERADRAPQVPEARPDPLHQQRRRRLRRQRRHGPRQVVRRHWRLELQGAVVRLLKMKGAYDT
jgi:hypothetical protein